MTRTKNHERVLGEGYGGKKKKLITAEDINDISVKSKSS